MEMHDLLRATSLFDFGFLRLCPILKTHSYFKNQVEQYKDFGFTELDLCQGSLVTEVDMPKISIEPVESTHLRNSN